MEAVKMGNKMCYLSIIGTLRSVRIRDKGLLLALLQIIGNYILNQTNEGFCAKQPIISIVSVDRD